MAFKTSLLTGRAATLLLCLPEQENVAERGARPYPGLGTDLKEDTTAAKGNFTHTDTVYHRSRHMHV